MTEIPTSEVLNRAADLIEERGWAVAKGWANQVPEGAPLCLEGAVQAVTELPRHDHNAAYQPTRPLAECPAYRAVQSYLDWRDDLWGWNDKEGRTESEVIEVLRACAVIEASRERESAGVAS